MSTKTLGRPKGSYSSPDRRRDNGEVTERLEAVAGKPGTYEHFENWCARYLRQSVAQWAGKALELEDWQKDFFRAVFERNPDGSAVWKRVVLVVSRKNGKSTMCSALALYELLETEGAPEILLAAASDRQAGRMFETVVNFVRTNPELRQVAHLREYQGEISRIDAPGKILRMSMGNLQGYNPSKVICDELAFWTKPSHRKDWAALTTAGGGRDLTQVVTITVAGAAEDRIDGILGAMVNRNEIDGELDKRPGLTISRNREASAIIFNYSAPTRDPLDVKSMKLANPSSWITEEYLLQQAKSPELTTAEILQMHGCVWTTGAKAWLPDGAWAMCADEKREVEEGSEIMVGFDGSYNNDSTALVGCTVEEKPHVFVLGVWERPIGVREWIVPRNEVETRVSEVFGQFKVTEMLCDPPGWFREIEEWGENFGSPPVITLGSQGQSKRGIMSEMCSRMYTAIVTKNLTHDGNPRLQAHMANATTKETPDGAYITKEDRHSPRKIDLAVGAVLAYGRASAVPSSAGLVF